MISRTNLLFAFVKMVKYSKHGMLLQFKWWSKIALSFDGLVFLNVKGDRYPNMFSRPNIRLFVSPHYVELHLPRVYLYTTPDSKSEGKRSLKGKTFESFLWLLKRISSWQEFSKPLRDFLNLILVCKKISPRYGNDKNKVFFPTVFNCGRLINNFSTNALKQLSINDKGYPSFKTTCYKKLSYSWTLVQSNEIDLSWIKTIVLLNCFFLAIVSFLIFSLYMIFSLLIV